MIILFLILINYCTANSNFIQQGLEDIYAETPTCAAIKIPACQDLPYNRTIFPNNVGHATQEEAGRDISQFESLVRVGCSSSLKLFLCTLYFPVCTEVQKPLPPCRSLCEQNRRDCEPIMREFHFKWPPVMECSQFPENEMCISESKTERVSTDPSYVCPVHMAVPASYKFNIRVGNNQVVPDCGIPCDHYLFDEASRRFSRLWIGLWSCLCAASTLFTVLTFLIDMPRFQYPERPIIFLSGCYLMIALTYVAGFILNHKVACSGPFPPPKGAISSGLPGSEMPRLITQGTKFEGCIILFMLLYFFTMASAIWWVVLTITWYLAAKCHWAHEAISRNAQYLHFAAWALPAAQTIGILALGGVDGDPLSGVCFTGLTDTRILKGFLITPLCVYLLIGTCFLIAGFLSLFKIRTIIKTEGSKTDDLEKLIMRIGVFSLLYIIPAIFVIACYIYEAHMADKWMLSWYTSEVCNKLASDDPSSKSHVTDLICPNHFRRLLDDHQRVSSQSTAAASGDLLSGDDHGNVLLRSLSSKSVRIKPEFELFMIKYLMTLIVGITSGIWIWSGKTLVSWQRFFHRLCRRLCCACCCYDPDLGETGADIANAGGHPGLATPMHPMSLGRRVLPPPQHPSAVPLLSGGGAAYPMPDWCPRGVPSGTGNDTSSPPSYDWIQSMSGTTMSPQQQQPPPTSMANPAVL